VIPALLAMVLFAGSAVSARKSVGHLGPAAANFWRQLLSVALLGILAVLLAGQSPMFGPATAWFLWSGVVGYGVGDTGIFLALPRLGSRLTSLMTQCLAAPIGALIEWLWLGHVPGWNQSLAGLVILGGVGLALAPARGEAAGLPGGWTGVFFGLVAALGQAGGAVLSRHGFEMARGLGQPADPMSVSFVRALAGTATAALWYGLVLRTGSLPPLADGMRRGWTWMVGNALAGPTLGVVAYQWALARHPIAEVLPVVAMAPLAVVPLAYWIEGERPSRRSVAGGVLAVLGVVWLARG
jgi:drug/metabolite transporter (DMT)-like permease